MKLSKTEKESIMTLFGKKDQKKAKAAIKQLVYIPDTKRSQIFDEARKIILTKEQLEELTQETEWQKALNKLSGEELECANIYIQTKIAKAWKDMEKQVQKRKKNSTVILDKHKR